MLSLIRNKTSKISTKNIKQVFEQLAKCTFSHNSNLLQRMEEKFVSLVGLKSQPYLQPNDEVKKPMLKEG